MQTILNSSRLNPVVFNGEVRTILEYVDVIWHSSITGQQSHTIESIHKRACKTISGNNYA